ncbi:MAG: YbhB/YbcL family Raf kinase inhibitor-like protein [Verrucomicrobia bacterium]|nr:YbhB/YbcL family Raf kinase inhibitor-like protein [Verrucomicrobiota bacterium]MBS0647176.1 YbhB/YbcL family Raf kinase inhibitor-like protein [Verrucomicrobiota bacterium]
MKLTSTAFEAGTSIPKKYTCQGEDISPPLEISQVPTQAKSLALIMDDPDVPQQVRMDRMWIHWVLFNLDPHIKQLPEDISGVGVLGQNTSGHHAYMGPCPPDREHRYFFKLYALDTLLKLSPGATKQELEKAMEGHVLAQATLMGRYEQH